MSTSDTIVSQIDKRAPISTTNSIWLFSALLCKRLTRRISYIGGISKEDVAVESDKKYY